MERESRDRAGSLSRPARRTRIWEYHISRQIITAEPAESLKTPKTLERSPAKTSPCVSKPLTLRDIQSLGPNYNPPRDSQDISDTHKA